MNKIFGIYGGSWNFCNRVKAPEKVWELLIKMRAFSN